MGRKVIQIADSTQLISLPRKWCLQHNLKKGDELEVEEQGSTLVINTDKQVNMPNIQVDVTGLDRTTLLYLIRSLYKRGYDEIRLDFSNPLTKHYRLGKDVRVLKVIHDEVSKLPGMEVIQERDTFCVLKAISNADTSEFDNVLRRIFILMQDAMDDLIHAGKVNDKVALEAVVEKHDSITKFVSYSLRLINRNPRAKKSDYFLYHIIAVLDKIIDIINVAARDLIDYNSGLSKHTVEALDIINTIFKLYYKLYYKWDMKIVHELNMNKELVKENILKIAKNVNVEELKLLYNMNQIPQLVRALTESRMAMEY